MTQQGYLETKLSKAGMLIRVYNAGLGKYFLVEKKNLIGLRLAGILLSARPAGVGCKKC